ncbi:hypothetical protein J132_10870 [Termitomyces sp. J132]|nr:hypothetical protein J132_10870 [Termitomyces sp. J132]
MSEPATSEATVALDEDVLPGPVSVTTQDEGRVPRRTVPNQAAKDLYTNWTNLLARLVTPYWSTFLRRLESIKLTFTSLSGCDFLPGHCLTLKKDFQKFLVEWCNCEELPYGLVANGLFPTAPLFPCFVISIHLLDFYCALFERLCDAVNAMASALNTFYAQREFIITDNKNGETTNHMQTLPLKDIMALIVCLIGLANQNRYMLPVVTSGWIAHPIVTYPQQTNGFDCGV